jgi:cytochrome oxidase assembly protein ShyY1
MGSELLRRAATTVLVAVVVAAGCVVAGVWQWNRHTDRAAAVALVEANYEATPVPLEQLVGTEPLPPGDVWRPVTAEGRYLGDPVLLRNRPVGGVPGFHVLDALAVTKGPLAGTVLVVDRGWVPTGEDGSDADGVPAAPAGPVSVVVRLRADEPDSRRDAPPGQVQAIAVDQVREAWAAATDRPGLWTGPDLGAYGALESEDGAAAAGLGPLPKPSTDPGPHLSYAFQWWVFAVGALVGAGVLLTRDAREQRRPPDDASEGPQDVRVRRRRRPTAEEEEDALLDAQH